MKSFRTGYDTETVRRMVEEATATPTTTRDVTNLCRRGALLNKAQVHPGFFHKVKTDRVIKAMLRRRLAAQLGRTSPRLLGKENDLTCNTCRGVGVKWEGRWLCEKGHGGNTNE